MPDEEHPSTISTRPPLPVVVRPEPDAPPMQVVIAPPAPGAPPPAPIPVTQTPKSMKERGIDWFFDQSGIVMVVLGLFWYAGEHLIPKLAETIRILREVIEGYECGFCSTA